MSVHPINIASIDKGSLLNSGKPFFLADVLAIKAARGDGDCAGFRQVMSEFQNGRYATIEGAVRQMKAMTKVRKSWVSEEYHARRLAFIADCERATSDDAMYRAQCEAAGVPVDAEVRHG